MGDRPSSYTSPIAAGPRRSRVSRFRIGQVVDPSSVSGRPLLVMFVVEDSGEWLVRGTARVMDGELWFDTPEADTLVPLPGGLDRLRPAGALSFADGAEFVTAVYVPKRPHGVADDAVYRTGLRFD